MIGCFYLTYVKAFLGDIRVYKKSRKRLKKLKFLKKLKNRHLCGLGQEKKNMRWYGLNNYRETIAERNGADVRLLDCWISEHGADRCSYDRPNDLVRLLRTGRNTAHEFVDQLPPYTDHPRLFKNSVTGEVWFTSQPYDRPEDIREEVITWAAERGLRAEVYGTEASWYYPGSTCLVVITKGAACE